MSALEIVVGDKVVYPNQGMCLVTGIKDEVIAGQKLTFVSLEFQDTGAKVKVPKDKLEKNGVRRVSNGDDAREVIDYLRSDSAAPSLKWKMRALENTGLMGKGTLLDLAKVLKNHYDTAGLRPLPPKEREQYNDARDLLVAELAVALGISEADAEDAIDVVLFPVGQERPRRALEDFAGGASEEDDGLEFPLDDEAPVDEPEEKEDEGEEDAEAGEGEADEAEGSKGKKKAARPAKTKGKAAAAPITSANADEEETLAATAALAEAPAKKRGRPAKAKAVEAPVAPPPAAKKAAAKTVKAPKAAPAEAPKKKGKASKAK